MEKLYVEKRASRGIAIAPAYKYVVPDLTPDVTPISEEQIECEKLRFEEAKSTVVADLEKMAARNEIFAAHLEIAGDFTLHDGVLSKIAELHRNAEQAVQETIAEFAAIFQAMDDAYMRERGADVLDIGKRIMAALKYISLPDLGNLKEEMIVVAKDLYPSDTVKLDPALVKGILTEEGGVTSHVSIIAKSLNIPILVGVKGLLEKVYEDEMICMDAESGEIVLNPDEMVCKEYQTKKELYQKECQRLEALRGEKIVTAEGKTISLCVNVGGIEDIKHALEVEPDGVGLFRSELLYMENSHFPTEEEQFAVYREASVLCPKELTIRTLDIGGDKSLPYFEFEKEDNPFLGWRAIRISLDMKEMFEEQLRAILRASAFGHVRIMFPMMISLEELRTAKKIVEECKQQLRERQQEFDETIEIGIMVETPASVFLAEELAREADFFSIGTNDLTQYILAVDRGNKKIADRYSYFNPAVLSAIRQVIAAGHKAGIKVGMCGEMAGDLKATEQLLEMGLDEFSMSAGSLDYIREKLLQLMKEK